MFDLKCGKLHHSDATDYYYYRSTSWTNVMFKEIKESSSLLLDSKQRSILSKKRFPLQTQDFKVVSSLRAVVFIPVESDTQSQSWWQPKQ